jgi:hypothetical protein
MFPGEVLLDAGAEAQQAARRGTGVGTTGVAGLAHRSGGDLNVNGFPVYRVENKSFAHFYISPIYFHLTLSVLALSTAGLGV